MNTGIVFTMFFFFANSMSNCNRDLCRRHIPAVVNAIKKLEAKQEKQPYVAAFYLTGDDSDDQKCKVTAGTSGNITIAWDFPQEYASIFQAALTDPNVIISTTIAVTYCSSSSNGKLLNDEYNALANMPMNGLGTPPFVANYYPDNTFISPLQSKLDEGLSWYNAIKSFIDGDNAGYQIYAGMVSQISITSEGFRITFNYLYELLNKFNRIPIKPDDPNYSEDAIEEWLQANVKLTRFNVSGIYTPSRLP